MKWIFIIALFLFLGAFFIISNENLRLIEQNGLAKFYDLYYGWIANLFSNAKSVSGYAVKFNWLPENNAENLSLQTQNSSSS